MHQLDVRRHGRAAVRDGRGERREAARRDRGGVGDQVDGGVDLADDVATAVDSFCEPAPSSMASLAPEPTKAVLARVPVRSAEVLMVSVPVSVSPTARRSTEQPTMVRPSSETTLHVPRAGA